MLLYPLYMRRRTVAFVLFKGVVGVDFCIIFHQCVPVHLGDNTCRADGIGQRVAVDNAVLLLRNVNRHIAVRQHDVGDERKAFNRPFHAPFRRL